MLHHAVEDAAAAPCPKILLMEKKQRLGKASEPSDDASTSKAGSRGGRPLLCNSQNAKENNSKRSCRAKVSNVGWKVLDTIYIIQRQFFLKLCPRRLQDTVELHVRGFPC